MEYNLTKFIKDDKLKVDPCARMFTTANACMILSKPRRFIACKVDPACFNSSDLASVQTFAEQVLDS